MTEVSSIETVVSSEAIPSAKGSSLSFPALDCVLSASQLSCLVGFSRPQLRAYLWMLAGISRPISGKVTIFGQEVAELNELQWRKFRCRIGYFSGNAPLHSALHGLMNVMLPALYHTHKPFEEIIDKAKKLLTEMNCQFEFTALPSQLDSFQQAQLALARALILDPALLILEVPLNNLGAKERERMWELLGDYKRNRAVCMIGGLQYPHFIENHADQIIFIAEHKMINFNGWKSFLQSEDAIVQELVSIL
ncbi:MAG: hypothetical protein HFP81_07585 [Methylococcales symbiont of Hymedesmia sp. n. MRB-2018]|nr:MAG: hypothetical protein HFP78_07960 [Methylococcales symbiont of Hymedesmia sp. n. MRB-2018]KAF3983382.1 MAG: hypothetical protein HFP81_07585 [Methylococcales symbiont of Hymedesmia sp. n. MRB-2018]